MGRREGRERGREHKSQLPEWESGAWERRKRRLLILGTAGLGIHCSTFLDVPRKKEEMEQREKEMKEKTAP